MLNQNFWDDALEYEMLFGDENESVECPHRGRKLKSVCSMKLGTATIFQK